MYIEIFSNETRWKKTVKSKFMPHEMASVPCRWWLPRPSRSRSVDGVVRTKRKLKTTVNVIRQRDKRKTASFRSTVRFGLKKKNNLKKKPCVMRRATRDDGEDWSAFYVFDLRVPETQNTVVRRRRRTVRPRGYCAEHTFLRLPETHMVRTVVVFIIFFSRQNRDRSPVDFVYPRNPRRWSYTTHDMSALHVKPCRRERETHTHTHTLGYLYNVDAPNKWNAMSMTDTRCTYLIVTSERFWIFLAKNPIADRRPTLTDKRRQTVHDRITCTQERVLKRRPRGLRGQERQNGRNEGRSGRRVRNGIARIGCDIFRTISTKLVYALFGAEKVCSQRYTTWKTVTAMLSLSEKRLDVLELNLTWKNPCYYPDYCTRFGLHN